MSKKKIETGGQALIQQIAKDIARVAKSLDTEPSALTLANYNAGGGKFNFWQLRTAGGFNMIKKTIFASSEEKDVGLITDMADLRKQYAKLEKHLGSQDLYFEKLKDAIEKLPKFKDAPYITPKKHNLRDEKPRTINLTLSDLHFGSDLVKSEVGRNWGAVEEARALAKVVLNVIEYKQQYRPITDLVVNILGDVIENQLHGAFGGAPLHEQTRRAMWLLAQAIRAFAKHFKSVKVNFAVGNHGRDIAINPTRALHQKWNGVERDVYYGVMLACQHLSNVSFSEPKTPWVSYFSQGHKIYATHGDTNLNPGNPGKKIDISGLEGQVDKINASLKDADEYKVFIVGHVHTPVLTQLPNGAFLVINGALVPPNSFAQSMNIMESQQVQVMFESTEKYAVGDFRFINVTQSDENNAVLDKLIQPFLDTE